MYELQNSGTTVFIYFAFFFFFFHYFKSEYQSAKPHWNNLTEVFVFCFFLNLVKQYADSDDEHDGMMDTDEEVTGGRVTLLNGNGPPYFHGYLYMKGERFPFFKIFLPSFCHVYKVKPFFSSLHCYLLRFQPV